jgi:hypothetical protein
MDRIKQLIREVLSSPPKEESCNCGCHSCENVGNKGPVLNESLNAKIIMTENMKYHINNKLPITENTFRYGSDAFLNLWAEARYLYSRNAIHVNDDDKEILSETNLGEYGIFEGKKVPLDLPMLEETTEFNINKVWDFIGSRPFYNKDYMPKFNTAEEIWDEWGPEEKQMYSNFEWEDTYGDKLHPRELAARQKQANYNALAGLNEAKDKKKTPPIGKPKRGGSKKFYVYVRDKGKIKKVSFGDTSGLSAKINNPEARRAFAARHDCKNKKDKTKASYWSCNIGRYWKSLGGSKNFYGYW